MSKPFSQACENNQQAIFEVLSRHFRQCRNVLEVGSGTGQHAVHFARLLPNLRWQTSDLAANHAGIQAWVNDSGLANIASPLAVDVLSASWPGDFAGQYQGVFSANTCHIMPWQAVQRFIPGVAAALENDGLFCLYGPFKYQGQYTSASNADFDLWLEQQAAHQALRDFEAVNKLAEESGMQLLEDNAMPANNQLLVWQKCQ